MIVLAQRIGGSGHAGAHLAEDFDASRIPRSWDGHTLKPSTLNFVLEVGKLFRTPKDGRASKQYIGSNGETYFLQSIRFCLFNSTTRQTSQWFPGLIHGNHPHPPEFDNVVEVIAPDLGSLLHSGKKEWFQLDGPFESV